MTLNQILQWVSINYPDINRSDLYDLIYFLSKKIKNYQDITFNLQNVIDFEFDELLNLINVHHKTFKPINRLIGHEIFDNYHFILNDNVFAPRWETFFRCKKLISELKNLKIKNHLDLCTGSGFISIILKKELSILESIGIDINDVAIKNAFENAKANCVQVKFINSSVENFLLTNKITYDIITCNPPYISKKDLNVHESAKFFDPEKALYAKNNGLYFYELILPRCSNLLSKKGIAIFEIGFNQKLLIEEILKKNQIKKWVFEKDFNNHWRVLKVFKE